MKKINKKRIVILISLLTIVMIEFFALNFSKAKNIVEITATISDKTAILSDETVTLNAIQETTNNYAITLPYSINEKVISKYLIEEKNITSNVATNENSAQTENTSISNQTEVEKIAGDKIYLTNEELKNKKISIKVEYNTKKEENSQTLLYQKQLSKSIDTQNEGKKLIVETYMPIDTELTVSEIDTNTVQELSSGKVDNYSLYKGFNIKLEEVKMNGTEEVRTQYNIATNQEVKIAFSGFEQTNDYKVGSIKTENNIRTLAVITNTKIEADDVDETLENPVSQTNKITFTTTEINEYALFENPNTTSASVLSSSFSPSISTLNTDTNILNTSLNTESTTPRKSICNKFK